MSMNKLRVRVGVVAPAGSAQVVMVDAQVPPLTALPLRVQLSQDFAQECPPGWPSPPGQTGAADGNRWCPRTIPAGQILTAYAAVANSIVAAGGGSIV